MDEGAADLEGLYRREGPDLLRYLLRRVGNRHDAEELFQQTFCMALRNGASLAAADSKRAWLIGIARNLLREHRRRRGRRRAVPIPDGPAAVEAPAEDPRMEALRRAIERLPEAQREVLALRLGDELSYAEIAAILAVPIGTVRSRIHHAVRRLRTLAVDEAPGTIVDASRRP